MAANVRKVRVTSYMKNVGRSVGTIVIDATRDYNPTIASLLKGSSDTIKEAKDAIRNLGNTETFKMVQDTITSGSANLLNDLKTGNIGKEHSELDDMFSEMDNFDFDSDYEDWGDEDSSQSSSSSAAEKSAAVSSVMKSTMAAQHKDNVVMANAISSATAKSAKHIAETTLMTSQAMYSLTQKGFQETISSITNLNTTVVNLSKLAEPINIHIQNSSVFFSDMKQIMPDIQQTLHKIEENTRPISSQKKTTGSSRKYNYTDIFDSSGNFDFDAWRDMVKGKGKDTIGLYMGLGQMALGMMGGKNTSIAKAGTAKVVDMLIPKIAKESMKAFNESLASAISSSMIRGRRYADKNSSSIIGQLLNIITPNLGKADGNIATNRYEKGPVSWDGKSRKALMEVIPAMLGNIYTAISGQEAPVYDYETGKFTKRSMIQKKQAYDKYKLAMQSGGDFKKDLDSFIKEAGFSEQKEKRIKKEIETYFLKALDSADDPLEVFEAFNKSVVTSYGLGAESWKIMKSMLNKYNNSIKQKRKNGSYISRTADNYINSLYRAKGNYNKNIEMLSDQGDTAYNSLVNNSTFFGSDEYNKNQLFYLQGIYEYTAFLAMNMPYMSGKTRKIKSSNQILNNRKGHFDAFTEAMRADREGQVRAQSQTSKTASAYDFAGEKEDEVMLYWGKSDAEIQAIKEKKKAEENAKKTTDAVSKYLKNMKGNIKDTRNVAKESGEDKPEKFSQKLMKGLGKVKSWYEAPFAAMSNFIDNMTFSLNNFFWGTNKKEGFIDLMAQKITTFFDRIGQGKNPFKHGDKSLKESMAESWGEIKNWFTQRATNAMYGKEGSIANKLVNDAENKYNAIFDAMSIFRNGGDARGRKVTKSGMVSVSEGELIIPSELNPFYHGSSNKRRQLTNEITNAKKFYGLMAGGGTAGEGSTQQFSNSKVDDIIKLLKVLGHTGNRIGDIVVDTAKDGSMRFYKMVDGKDGKLTKKRIKAEKALDEIKNAGESMMSSASKKLDKAKGRFSNAMRGKGAIDGVIPFLGNSVGTLMDGFQKTFSSIFGGKDEIEKQKSRVKDVAASALDSLGESKGAGAIGALGGAGISLLTGMINPLAGAAIGGAIGITIKSKAVQDALFGVDENGERDYEKGVLPKEIGKFMEKQLPDIGIGAGLGTTAGFVMGSPVLGAVVGSAIGFAKSSDNVKNTLFGKMKYDKDGNPIGRDNTGLISPEAQKKIKDNLGAIGAGSIVGATLGAATGSPIGLIGGIALGGVGGLVATSDSFKTWMFGDGKDDKGFTGLLKDKIFKNIEDIGLNIMSGIKGHGKRLFNALTRKATLTVQKIGTFINNRIFKSPNSLIGKIGRGAVGLAKKPFQAAGALLEKGKNITRDANLKAGFDVYEGGKKLNAAERLALSERTGNDKYASSNFGALDKALAGMDQSEVETVRDALEAMKNPKAMRKYADGQVARIFSKIKIKGGDKKKLTNLVISGQWDKAQAMVSELDPTGDLGLAEALNQAIQVRKSAFDQKEGVNKLKESMKTKYGIDFNGNKGEISSAIDRTKSELGRFEEDEAEISDNVAEIREIIESIAHEGIPTWINKNKKKGTDQHDEDEMYEGKIIEDTDKNGKKLYYVLTIGKNGKLVKKRIGNAEGAAGFEAQKKKTTENTMFGPMQMEDDGDGGLKPDESDTQTKIAMEEKNKFFNSVSSLPLIGPAIGKLGGFLGGIKDKLFGDEEGKNEGILTSIWKAFTGKTSSIFSAIGQFLTGIPGVSLIKNLTAGMTFKTVLAEAAGAAIVGALLSGRLDSFFHRLNPNAFGDGKDVVTDKDGNVLNYNEEKGGYVDEEGNIVTDVNVGKSGADSTKQRSWKALGRQILTGKTTWLGKLAGKSRLLKNAGTMLGKTSVGKGASALSTYFKNVSSKTTKMMTKGGAAAQAKGTEYWAKVAAKGEAKLLVTQLDDACVGLAKGLKRVPLLKSVLSGDKIDDMCRSLAKSLGKAAERLGPKVAQASASLTKAIPFINIAFMVMDFTTGYEDAASTLGITSTPTIGQRLLAGTLRLVKNLIPIVGPLIPDSIVVDVVANYIAPALGIDITELTNAREAAKKEVAEYNAEHGTNLSVTEYNKQVRHDYTWTERIGNSIKGVGANIKQDFASIKEKGFGQFAKDRAGEAWSSMKDAFGEKGGGIAGIISGLGAGMEKLLPGVLGEAVRKDAEIKALAFQGKISEMWKVSLSDFSQNNENEAAPTIFSKLVGQLPLIMSKVMFTPVAAVCKATKPIIDSVNEKINKIISGFNLITTETKRGLEITKDPNTDIHDVFDISSSEFDNGDNPFGGLGKVAIFTSRLAGFGIALFGRILKPVGEFVTKIGDSIKEDWQTFKQNNESFSESDGAVDTGINILKSMDDYKSPISGIFRGGSLITGSLFMIKNSVTSVFKRIGEGIDNLKESFKTDYDKFNEAKEKYQNATDLKSTMAALLETGTSDFTSPIGGIFKTISLATGVGYMFKNLFKSAFDEDSPLTPILNKLANLLGFTTAYEAGQSIGGKIKSGLSNVGQGIANIGQKAKEWITGGDSGFASQYDPRYAGQHFANSNFGDKGCGPAVAVMASNGKLSMSQAIARSRRYQNGGGVSADYFADVLGGNVRYISGAGSKGSRVMNTLARGGKAILLGRDPYNNSKAYSPFGPNNHYVLATGLDRAGNLIINDPEGRGPRSYDPSILNSVGMSMLSGGDSAMMGVPTDVAAKLQARAEAPKGKNDTDIARNVYGFLTGKGFSPGAAAGIMGNLFAESGMDPTRRQGGGGPAAGIAQWENANAQAGRWKDMANFAASRGKNWTDLESQLEFLVQELEQKDMANRMSGVTAPSNLQKAGVSPMAYEDFKKSNDINATTRLFEAAFERAGKPHMDSRLAAAKEYYNWYSGSQWTGSFDSTIGSATGGADSYGTIGTSGTSGTSGSSGSSGGIAGLLGIITSAFSKIGSIFSGSDSENNSKNLTGTSDNQDNNAANAATTGGDLTTSGSTVQGEMANNFPYYSQADPRWGSKPYGSHGTLQSSACGPTSMAMVLKSYGTNVTPEDTANWSAQHGYRAENGTSWGYFNAIGKESGLDVQQFEDSGTAQQMLDSGVPVIASMRAGHFTKGGHFIVLAGKNGDEILVNDPGKKARTHGWPSDTVFSEAKQYWAVSKDGKGSIGNVAKNEIDTTGMSATAIEAMRRGGANISAAGSGIGGGSRWILNNNFGKRRRSSSATNRIAYARRFSGGDAGMNDRYDIIQDTSDMLFDRSINGNLSSKQMEDANAAIIAILKVIAQNTSFVNEIYDFLKAVLSGGGSKKGDVPEAPKPKKTSGRTSGTSGSGEIDASLRSAVMTLAAIARG